MIDTYCKYSIPHHSILSSYFRSQRKLIIFAFDGPRSGHSQLVDIIAAALGGIIGIGIGMGIYLGRVTIFR